MRANEYRLGYRGDIEGLRAVAILLVIGAHAGVPWLGGGFVGVDIFFVLSGFLITGLLVREVIDTGRVRLADFYLRRLRRLFPALFLMLMVSSLLAATLLAPREQLPQAEAGASALVWLSNVYFAEARLDYFAVGTETNIFLHTWSLGVEEQFYLVWPLLVYLALRHREREVAISRLRACMILVAVISFSACLFVTHRAAQFAFYMMPLRAWQFAVGALVSLHYSGWSNPVSADRPKAGVVFASPWMGSLGLILLLGSGLLLNANVDYPGAYALVPTLGAVCVIASGSRGMPAGVSWLLSWRLLQAIGRVSYSWYLWHWPMLLLGYALTGSKSPLFQGGYVAFSLLCAIVSYVYVESPIRHQPAWLKYRRAAAGGVLGITVLGGVAFFGWTTYAYTRGALENASLRRFENAPSDSPIIYSMGCDDWYHSADLKVCAFGSEKATHTVVLVGDSVAGQWFPAVQRIFDRPDWRLVVLNKSHCPLVDQPFFYDKIGREYTECSIWRDAALKHIAASKPDVVLMTSADTYDFTREQWKAGSQRVMRVMSGASSKVYVLRSTPHLPFDATSCLIARVRRPAWLNFGSDCSATGKDAHSDQVYIWLQQAALPFGNIRFLDMSDQVCPQGICRAERGDVIIYKDAQHMTASFAATLAPTLRSRMHLDDDDLGSGLDAAAK